MYFKKYSQLLILKECWLACIVFCIAAGSTYVTWLFSRNLTFSLGWLPLLVLIVGIALDILLFVLLSTLLTSFSRARKKIAVVDETLKAGERSIKKKEQEIETAKDEFVSLASHQLRTPLATINWYTEMLLSGDAGKLTRDQKKYLQEIYQSSTRMTELVNALLNISRIELATFSIEPEPIKVKRLLEDVLKEFVPIIRAKKLCLKKTVDPRQPLLSIDQKLLHIVLENLISNAIHYTPDRGIITLETRKGDNDLVIQITDTGYGIPKAQHDNIFTKLFRADNVRERDTTGNGLGLHLVKLILEQSGCEIWFDSQENSGTTFYVSIPLQGMKQRDGVRMLV
ncbi:HAMP domain-containing histidine kinase [Candidatus Uhrbacteria bacterium]|nr:HAMP domain-containing histidine kinase [Candidatus Uhrbacteria bacterium]